MSRSSTGRPTTSFSRCSTRRQQASSRSARSHRRSGGSCASTRTSMSNWPRSPASTSSSGWSLAVRPGGAECAFPYDSLIVAPGSDDLVLRQRGPRQALAPDEDDRRRPQPATADIRGVRAGRDGAFRGRAQAVADLCRRRWRTDRLRGRGTDRRARAADAQRGLSCDRRHERPRAPFRRRQEHPRDVRRRTVPESHERARGHGSRDSHRGARDEHRRRRHGRRISERQGARRDAHGRLGSRRAGLSPCARPRRGRRSGV